MFGRVRRIWPGRTARGRAAMPWGLGIWVLMRGFRLWLRWVVPGRGHAGGRRVVPGDGRFHGPAGWCPGVVLRCLRWSGGRVREGDDGGGGPGGGPGAPVITLANTPA